MNCNACKIGTRFRPVEFTGGGPSPDYPAEPRAVIRPLGAVSLHVCCNCGTVRVSAADTLRLQEHDKLAQQRHANRADEYTTP